MGCDCLLILCGTSSDNVVRAGLTPKFKDVPTLLDMLTYRSCDARTIVMVLMALMMMVMTTDEVQSCYAGYRSEAHHLRPTEGPPFVTGPTPTD